MQSIASHSIHLCMKTRTRESLKNLEQTPVHLGKKFPTVWQLASIHMIQAEPASLQKSQYAVQFLEEAYDVQNDKVDLHTVTIDTNTDRIHVDDTKVTCHPEASTVLQMPADGLCTWCACVKVDTRAGSHKIPVYLLHYSYPNQGTLNSTLSGPYQLLS